MIVDTEEMARKRAPAIAKLQELAEHPGRDGLAGRLGLATLGFDDWVAAELKSGTALSDIMVAVMKRAATLVAGQFITLGRGDDAAVVEARQALLSVFEQQLLLSVGMFDRMSDAERAAHCTTLHTAQ